ncbi:MAG: glycosyltransferase family 4 protein [Chloroflexota bacterium]
MPFSILMVTDSYLPLIGGATRDTQLLCRELVKRGHQVVVATAWNPGMPEQEFYADDGVKVYRIKGLAARMPWFSTDPGRRHHPPFPDPAAVWAFRRVIHKVRPDLVHSYGWITYSCAAAMWGKKIPMLLSARDYSNICAVRTLVREVPGGTEQCSGPAPAKCMACATRYYRGKAKAAVAVGGVLSGRTLLNWKMSGLHSCSTYVRGVMRRHLLGKHGARLDSMPNLAIQGFRDDGSDTAPEQAILDRLPAEPFILFVGALRLVKGLEPLMAAYQRLAAPPPLVLMGTPQPETPKEFPPGVTVLHSVPHGTVMAAWERALFGVAPSLLAEPLGNVVHEGMSKGKAMIGTAPSGMADMIIPDETGLLVQAGNVDALADAMRRLIDDGELRERLGRAARERAGLFTADIVVPRFEALYTETLRTSRIR